MSRWYTSIFDGFVYVVQVWGRTGCGCSSFKGGNTNCGRAYCQSDEGLSIWRGHVWIFFIYWWGVVENMSSTRLKVWEFGSSRPVDEESTDSSYSSQALFSHTDGTYMTESPGLQVQACSMSPMSRLSIALIVRRRAAGPLKLSIDIQNSI